VLYTAGVSVDGAIPELSVVTTLYRSQQFIESFLERIRGAIDQLGISAYEIVLVDDGSPDESLAIARLAAQADPHLRVVELSRNFGHHHAALAGLNFAQGERVFLIDCDLEVAPAVLGDFVRTMQESGADVVYGVQQTRKGGPAERLGGALFWRLFNGLSDTRVPANVLTERLMSRRYLDALLRLGDRNIFLAGMMYWAGFSQVAVAVEKGCRAGPSSYSLRKRFALLIEAVTSFSTVPLKLVLGIGLLVTSGSFLAALFLMIRKLLYPAQVLAGYTSLILVVLGMGGIIVTLMGVLGLYIARIFIQTQGRPTFIVRAVHGGDRKIS
jgi:putative glycosyltransferase